MDWFLYDIGLHRERVKGWLFLQKSSGIDLWKSSKYASAHDVVPKYNYQIVPNLVKNQVIKHDIMSFYHIYCHIYSHLYRFYVNIMLDSGIMTR